MRVVSAGDWAEASYDYRHLDQLVSFEHSDFARDRVPAKRRSVFAGRYRSVGTAFGRGWIARKSGIVTILDDIMVEETETFMVTLSIMAASAGFPTRGRASRSRFGTRTLGVSNWLPARTRLQKGRPAKWN